MSDKETKATKEQVEKKETIKKSAASKKETAKKPSPAKKDTAQKTAASKKETAKKATASKKETAKKATASKKDSAKKVASEKKETTKKTSAKKKVESAKKDKASMEKSENKGVSKKVKDVKDDKKAKIEAENKDAQAETEENEAKVKGSKKTKAEINKEIKATIAKENVNASRKDRNRAEKTAMRLAKEDRKAAYTQEQKKAKLSNLIIACMIFGVLLLMFAIPWGYNYFKKDASIEAYISNRGGVEVFKGIELDKNKKASLSADGNKMFITVADTSKDIEKELKYFKGKDGKEEMEFYSAYFLSIIRPDVRGVTASAVCTVNVGKKQAAEITVKYSQIEEILAKRGVKPEDLYNQQKQQEEEQQQAIQEQTQGEQGQAGEATETAE